jgi:Lysyl oxidase/WD40-like Beta Propeller Repeat
VIIAAVLALAGGAGRDPEPLLLVESLGDVVAVHASGERERLATGRDPALSHDGRRIAFVRGSAVFVLTLSGGRLVQSGIGTSPAWSPDGRLAVAAPDGVRVAGRLVVPGATEPAWASDGRLAVVTQAGIAVDGALVVPGGRSPAFAPDGRLAYVVGDDVHVDGELVASGARQPAWDPAGRLGVVTAAGIVVDGTPVPGTRPGDSAPSWGPDDPGPDLLLPDLDQRAPSGLTVTATHGRFRLGFTSASDNLGRGRLWIRGVRASSRMSEMRADQIVQIRNGGVRVFQRIGRIRFVNDPPHHHWHLMRFQEFELRRASDFAVVERDRKTGFCLSDGHRLASARVRPHFVAKCGQRQTGRMSVEMGTSVGYADLYPGHFHGQSLDMTGVPAGVYVLVHRVNASHLIRELRYDNNAASARIRIGWPHGVDRKPSIRVLRVCPGSERC